MLTRLTITAALALATGAAFAQPAETKQPPILKDVPIVGQPVITNAPTTPSPLEFDNVVHDWGAIGDDEPVTHKFAFKNITDKVINIIDTKTSCGCSVAAPSKRNLAPGESATIDVTFNPKGKRGQELKTITVVTDYAASPNTELHLKAFVRPRMVIEPASIWFGDLPLRTGGTQEITVMNRTPGFKVTEFSIKDTAKFTVEKTLEDVTDLDGQPVSRARFKVTFTDSAPIGTHQTALVLTTTDPQNPAYTIAVNARVSGDLQVAPERMLVPMRGPAQPWRAESIIAAKNVEKPFDILSVEAVDTPADMHVAVDVINREANSRIGYRIIAAGLTPQFINDIKGFIRVRTTVKDMEVIEMPLMGLWQGNTMPGMAPGAVTPMPGVGNMNVTPTKPMK